MKNLGILSTLVALSTFACGGQKEGGDDPAAAASVATAATSASSLSVRLERASRQVETGEKVSEARADLAVLVGSPELSATEKEDASLWLSRAYEMEGDKEKAIATVEGLIASHGAKVDEADRRLRKLLTGDEASRFAHDDDNRDPTAPVAAAFIKYFPKNAAGTYDVVVSMIGAGVRDSDRLGTFGIGEAIRRSAERACALCEKPKIHTGRHGHGSWTAIPGARGAELDRSLAVFYYDQQDGRIPARYDALLPMPTAEIEKRLASGDGFVAVKERPNAPPVVLVAAPRWGQLATVEEAFSKLNAIPAEPFTVKVASALMPREIQSVVRGGFDKMRGCYEQLTKREPKAQGKFVLAFKITGEGRIDDVRADDATTLKDGAFGTCMVEHAKTLVFPASRAKGDTTVRYPIEFAN